MYLNFYFNIFIFTKMEAKMVSLYIQNEIKYNTIYKKKVQ